ncbi:uncharacterized protein Eint_061510 [Encephalitozoon intestinalis ATCC 50506]|uniref:Uncharacterized protein n=1 Tax=Encephalitozoon intestinalis (strain ATCC 50506) TaxID=876142 RepID=E0S7S7_ENCIT|nr:uncharacterized protein Eint_061510 [Encephalitozoon intestinalis ATCC 50506]ADM11756.2 hypothetical protein Eint_061510 [Encephalitozoon intestinalis ATCC 50506]UTX45497.1 hypothetical protein GPK93_06g10540 [Encephalitozoon intestinalis]
MISMLVFLPFVICDRLLRLKHKDSQYVTNNNGILKLDFPLLPSLSDQRVVVHNRVLYFLKDGIYYTLAMVHGELEIKLIVYNAMGEKSIGFSSNPSFRPHRKKIDPFGYLSHPGRKDNPNEIEKTKDVPSSKRKPASEKLSLGGERFSAPKKREQISSTVPKDQEEYGIGHGGWKERGFRQAKQRKSLEAKVAEEGTKSPGEISDEIGDPDNKKVYDVPSESQLDVEVNSTLHNIRLPRKSETPKRSYVVESDSKMDEHEFGYVIKNVAVSEVDNKGHFTLVGGKNSCVTYYKDSFVFMPCSRAPEQIFKLESSEEVLKKGKSFSLEEPKATENQEAIILDSTESEDEKKEELYKGPQGPSYFSKDIMHDSTNSKIMDGKSGFKSSYSQYLANRLDKDAHMDYNRRNSLENSAGNTLHPEKIHIPLRTSVETIKPDTGVTSITTNSPVQEKRSNGKNLSSKMKETSKHQKLNLDDDFIDKFRELLTNSDLNDFV